MKMINTVILTTILMLLFSCTVSKTTQQGQRDSSINLKIETKQKHLGFQNTMVEFAITNNSNSGFYIPIPSENLTSNKKSPEFFKMENDLDDCFCNIYYETDITKKSSEFVFIKSKETVTYERNFLGYNYDCFCESSKSDTINISLSYEPDPDFFETINLNKYYAEPEVLELQKLKDQILMDTLKTSVKVIIVK